MYLELQEDQQEHHPFPAASASKPELAEYKRKVMGQMKRQDELQIKREEKNEQENERRKRLIEEHQERQKQERIIEKANDKLKRQLGMFAPWINTQYEQQYKKQFPGLETRENNSSCDPDNPVSLHCQTDFHELNPQQHDRCHDELDPLRP